MGSCADEDEELVSDEDEDKELAVSGENGQNRQAKFIDD